MVRTALFLNKRFAFAALKKKDTNKDHARDVNICMCELQPHKNARASTLRHCTEQLRVSKAYIQPFAVAVGASKIQRPQGGQKLPRNEDYVSTLVLLDEPQETVADMYLQERTCVVDC